MEIKHALGRLSQFYDTDGYTADGHRISALVTSEYGVGLILDNHVNRPAYVKKCLERALERTALPDPSGAGLCGSIPGPGPRSSWMAGWSATRRR